MRDLSILLPSALCFGAVALAAAPARATDCTTLPNPVYVVGFTAVGPVVAKISAYLAIQSPPVTIVYGGTGSCAGVAEAIDTVSNPNQAVLVTPMGKPNFFKYADGTGAAQTCDITASDAGAPVYPNIALSDVFADSCAGVPLPPNGIASLGITESLGPVQAMTFVAPVNSTEYAISAEAAYMVFGFGNQSNVKPWIDVTHMFQRGPTSGTQSMLAAAIKVPSTRWYGMNTASTNAMITALGTANASNDSSAIGILGAADVDPLRRAGAPQLRELAYRHFGQNCSYLPDSAAGLYDKRNVRDGHYAVWGPLHVLSLPTADMQLAKNQQTIVSYLTGAKQAGGLDVIASEAQSGLVPQCAMRVKRDKELGPMAPAAPGSACGCYYEYAASPTHALTTKTCTACAQATDCPSGFKCPQWNGMGWCEPT